MFAGVVGPGGPADAGPSFFALTRAEGIDHGRTGFLCDTVEEMSNLVRCLPTISRAAVRAEAVRRFSDSAVIDEYERVYRYLRAA